MKSILLVIILVMFVSPCLSQQKSNKKPFVLKLIEKPSELKIGKTYTFVFELLNTSKTNLTLSSLCATPPATLTWRTNRGITLSTGSNCGGGTLVTSHSYNPITKKITGITKSYPYSEDDFFTLSPNGTKRFETELEVPKDLKARFAIVHIKFESKYDGRLIGIRAWRGAPSHITLRMPIVK